MWSRISRGFTTSSTWTRPWKSIDRNGKGKTASSATRRRFSSLHTDFDNHASAPSDTTCSFDLERAGDVLRMWQRRRRLLEGSSAARSLWACMCFLNRYSYWGKQIHDNNWCIKDWKYWLMDGIDRLFRDYNLRETGDCGASGLVCKISRKLWE